MYIISDGKYCLSNQYEKSAENLIGYGGVWVRDKRKAKRFKSIYDARQELIKMRVAGSRCLLFIEKR